MRRMGLGLQLYTLRDDLAADFAGTLRQVAELGYEGVEFAGGYGGMKAEELRDLLAELKLKAIGAHVGLKALRENLDGEMAYLQTIGARYLICPSLPPQERNSEEGWKRLFAFFAEVGRKANEQGLQFGYHNHAFEFDIRVDGEFAFDALYKATSSSDVKAEMDVCWVQFAGQDPLAYIRNYAERLPLLHLKDFRRDPDDNKPVTLVLGEGSVDLPGIVAASSDAGVEWLIVEQDRCQRPPLASVADSLTWLRKHYLPLV